MNPLTKYGLANMEINSIKKENYSLEKSKDGKYIIKISNGERDFYIGSKYSVDRDVKYFLSQIEEFNVNTIFIVFGLGAGEQILELLKQISSSNKILIVEPDVNIIATFNSLEHSKEILEDNRVVLTSLENDKLNNILCSFIEEFNINNIKVLTFANYDKNYSSYHIQFYESIRGFLEMSAININTSLLYSQQFFRCFVKNIKYIVKSTIINEVKNKFQNIPAVVVSAGPSLEKNINMLKEIKDKFIIIAGGRTVKPLLEIGVNPDFIAVIDPTEACYKLVENSLDCAAPLVFCEVTNYDVVEKLKGKKVFFQEGINLEKVTSEILGKKVDSIFQGGSVAHTCASFAEYIGCNPIIFIGQDFAYTNNKLHADIASVEQSNEHIGDELLVEDIHGNLIPTNAVFNMYRRRMELFIKTFPKTTFINSTEGGANMEGTIVMDFKEAIHKYEQTNKFDRNGFDILDHPCKIDKDFVKVKIKKLIIDMNSIKKDCHKAIKYSNEVLQHYASGKNNDINSLLNSIKKINGKIEKINFIDSLLKPTVFRILMHPEFMEKMNESNTERGIRLAEQTKRLYEDIIIAIDEAIPFIEEYI